jgi:hypothetical protein
MATITKTTVFKYVKPRILIRNDRRYGDVHCFHLQVVRPGHPDYLLLLEELVKEQHTFVLSGDGCSSFEKRIPTPFFPFKPNILDNLIEIVSVTASLTMKTWLR